MAHSHMRFTLAPLAVAVLFNGPLAHAQQGNDSSPAIEEITVTAQKREENLQQTPIAITALSSDALGKLGANNFADVAKNTPSISFTPYPSSSTTLIMYMRGQGVSDSMQITADGSVGLYVDGFYISRPQSSTFDLADVERVEVLRGPQGTLYGRNTTGGAVNIISKKPTGEFGFKQTLSFGNRNQFRSLTSVDLPKLGDVSTKFTLLKSDKDGYVKNSGSGHDFNEEGQQAGRFSLNWSPSDQFSVDYFFEMGNIETTPIYYQNPTFRAGDDGPRSRSYRDSDLKQSKSDFEAHGLTLTWDVSEALTVKSLTGYRDLSYYAYQDYMEVFPLVPFSPNDPVWGAFQIPIVYLTDDWVNSHQFTQEFQFIGDLGERWKYVAGLYYFQESANHQQNLYQQLGAPNVIMSSVRDVTAESSSMAAYAQATWTPPVLDDRLELTFGLRYTEDDREAARDFVREFNGFPIAQENSDFANNDQDFDKFNPAFTANFNVNDDLSVYGKVVTGYKAGGSSESGNVGGFDRVFDPEEVTTYELGLKSYWWDRRVRSNIALFYSDFDDMQLAFVEVPTDPSIVLSQNAGKATVKGAELELTFAPTDDLTFNVNYTYLDPEIKTVDVKANTIFDNGTNPYSPYEVGENVADLFALPYAPENSIAVSMDYTMYRFAQGDVSLFLNYRWQDEQHLTANSGPGVPNNDLYILPSYGLMDARLTLSLELPRGDSAKISLWGKNVFDKEYRNFVIANGGAVDAPNASFPLGPVVLPAGYANRAEAWAEPASYGIELVYQY